MAPSTKTSYPGRLLAALAVLIIVMLAGVLQGNIIHPAKWHDSFKVALGLDLSSGTNVTLKAVPPHGHAVPSAGEMTEAISIMEKRVNSAGFTGAQVQQQGNQLINVSVPGAGRPAGRRPGRDNGPAPVPPGPAVLRHRYPVPAGQRLQGAVG